MEKNKEKERNNGGIHTNTHERTRGEREREAWRDCEEGKERTRCTWISRRASTHSHKHIHEMQGNTGKCMVREKTSTRAAETQHPAYTMDWHACTWVRCCPLLVSAMPCSTFHSFTSTLPPRRRPCSSHRSVPGPFSRSGCVPLW